jgi:hypothetical protein
MYITCFNFTDEKNYLNDSTTACSKRIQSVDFTNEAMLSKKHHHATPEGSGTARGYNSLKSCDVCGNNMKVFQELPANSTALPPPLINPQRFLVNIPKLEMVKTRIRPIPFKKVTTIIHPLVKFE